MNVSANGTTVTLDDNILTRIIAILFAFGVVSIVIGILLAIVWYIFQSIGLSKLAKNRDIEHSWLAWIPVANDYLLGELIGNKVWGFGYAKWILVLIPILTLVISSNSEIYPDFVSIIMLIILVVFYVYSMSAMFKLYKIYSTKPVVLLVFTIIFPFLSSIFIFAIRNNKPIMLPQTE